MKTQNWINYVAALKAHNAKIAAGKRTNRASLWHKAELARREMQAGEILTQEECDRFHALTEAEAKA